MSTRVLLYICPRCFEACETPDDCHAHTMLCCDVGVPGDERRQPLIDDQGRLHSRAPRWFLEAMGWMPSGKGLEW